jgi:hypothetical protein
VEYVRICAVHGPGFFYIPGSDTCIRLSGRARYEYIYTREFNQGGDPSSFNATGRLAVDARTQTDWGLLRAYFRVDFSRNSGGYFGSGSGYRGGTKFGNTTANSPFPSFSGVDTFNFKLQTGVGISAAFVQWGGLTAGRIQSFFDFYADNDTWFGIEDSDTLTQALAYTYTFGSGFSATLSIEDPKERQAYPIAGISPIAQGGINSFAGLSALQLAQWNNVFPIAFSPFNPLNYPFGLPAFGYVQRESVPDVVGVLRVDQGWGSAQLSAAYHRIETEGSTVNNLTPNNTLNGFVVNPLVSTVPGGFGHDTGNGWAIQGGVKVNVPYFATGDYLYLQAAYAKGGISYLSGGWPGTRSTGALSSTSVISLYAADAVIGPTGKMTLTPGYSADISYEHYWTPTIRQGIFAGALHLSYSEAIRGAAAFAQGIACPTCLGTVVVTAPNGGQTPFNPFSIYYDGGWQYVAGSNLIWSPIKDLDIGVEMFYARDHLQHKQWDQNAGVGQLTSSQGTWLGRLRIQRDF